MAYCILQMAPGTHKKSLIPTMLTQNIPIDNDGPVTQHIEDSQDLDVQSSVGNHLDTY